MDILMGSPDTAPMRTGASAGDTDCLGLAYATQARA